MYARLEDFDGIIHTLAHDSTLNALNLTTAEVLAVMSALLATYANADLPPATQELVLQIARLFSAVLIERYQFSEGYIDFLFGAAMMRRAAF